MDDGGTLWRGRQVSVRERKRNAERAKEWRDKNEENKERFKTKRDEWTAKNQERIIQNRRANYKRNREAILLKNKRAKDRRIAAGKENPYKVKLEKKYGITLEIYAEMYRAQNGLCAICGNGPSKGSWHGKLGVDHCHDTGAIRGLLCDDCNVGIGRLKDDPERLRKALQYLEHAEDKRRAGHLRAVPDIRKRG
jgi:hypothetical protein